MERFTASYGGIRDNFTLINIDSDEENKGPEYGMICVVENIIQRGCPTIPSAYLREQTGISDESMKGNLHLVSEETPVWSIIKGDDIDLYYPAEEFYYNLLPEYLGDLEIARNLIIPEADFRDILGDETPFDGQMVDFYLPQLHTVIEIDGEQHTKENQNFKDSERDKILRKNNISVIRITTQEMREETEDFIEKMKQFRDDIYKAKIVDDLITPQNYEEIEESVAIDSIMRIQILLLELMKTGKLSLSDTTWKINFVNSDVKDIENLTAVAYEDLKLWMSSIAQLIKTEVRFPELKFTSSKDALSIDFSIFKRYTDAEENNTNCIYVRNDYYQDQNFYRISNADNLKYKFTPETIEEDDKNLKYLLNNIFPDIENFRDGQPQIIKHVLMGNDTIGILPTGTGKSLCYQLSALLQPGVCVVIVPIISLMLDQQESMENRSIMHVNSISSSLSGSEKDKILRDFLHGKYQFIWISPERFQNKDFRKSLAGVSKYLNFALAVIDEVHCLSEWGHDFRVSYLSLIKLLREYCKGAPILGLTATASQAVLEDLKAEFGVDGSAVKALTDMDRPELNYHRIKVNRQPDKAEIIYSIIKDNDHKYTNSDGDSHDSIGLVFCPTVRGRNTGCIPIEKELSSISEKDKDGLELRLTSYHGKLTNKKRNEIQENFMNDDYDVLLCTKAFGMGIDQPHIKYTIHDSMPQSIESFYQEAGRAGRDRDKSVKSDCYILYCPESSNDVVKEIFDPNTSVDERKALSKKLHGDLNTIMWFWNNNRETSDQEYRNIKSVLIRLYQKQTKLIFDEKRGNEYHLEKIQEALYKLSILGVVKTWTVEYASLEKGTVDVEYLGIDETGKKHKKCLLSYIHRYDPQFQIDKRRNDYQIYYRIAHDKTKKPFTRMMMILIEWTNENILNNRLQSTYNMMQWLSPDVSDSEFRNRIREYFRFSEESVVYDGIIYHPLQFDNWFDLLFVRDDHTKERTDEIIPRDAAELKLAGLQRYLESYRYNTGLNYLSGILRMYTGNYRGTEGEWRIDGAFNNIREQMDEESQETLIDETLKFAEHFDIEGKDDMASVICKYFPEDRDKVFRSLNDRYSLSLIMEDQASRVDKIMEELA
jgi:ATP-dependent DNA helicase RecQ